MGTGTLRDALSWLAAARDRTPDVDYALEALGWCHVLGRRAQTQTGAGEGNGAASRIGEETSVAFSSAKERGFRGAKGDSAEPWQTLLEHLLGAVEQGRRIELLEQPLLHQLLAGELAFTLACRLPQSGAFRARTESSAKGTGPCFRPTISPKFSASEPKNGPVPRLCSSPEFRGLHSVARRALSSGLRELLDGEGLPHARYLDQFRPLAACWTRCRTMAQQCCVPCWSPGAESQYQWLVRCVLRLTRSDGSQVFAQDAGSRDHDADLIRTALSLGGDDDDRVIAALVLPRQKRPAKRIRLSALPPPTLHSEWAATAIMQTTWAPATPRLTAVWPGRSMRLELACAKELLWSGPWEWDIRLDGQPLAATSDWEETCWFSDREADYLELEIELGHGARLQRHVLLGKADGILFLADAVLGRQRARIEYRGILPLCPGVTLQGAEETREAFLLGRQRRALVLPLALPEWRCDHRVGELTQTARGLELTQTVEGRRMFAPLWFDLDRRRMIRPRTWRQLTVAESLRAQPADVAVGYRAQVGRQQWLLYRSLATRGNRTLLAHNLSTELLVARFDPEGEIGRLVEIE